MIKLACDEKANFRGRGANSKRIRFKSNYQQNSIIIADTSFSIN